ncbi:uncharacterized protein SOCG_01869 [Schizosaccharomyces octosporus yFS286]|uniref:Uncharacterized protein n=1 Tax=Schizosaccharomyces octosporus (strain yFS286) TaxID=483514 RepID=S9RC15_SCHOY|nr:uncharacterized protein SOCG_01869 [Schizosaccharomyces octosporus yFS286]EPX71654.1 hypothetical protein SOCG_01869 [Schizosaccharomyces octosporus yFS286]
MEISIRFLIILAYFSLGWATPFNHLSKFDGWSNLEPDYPFYVQKFPYSQNCNGNVSYIMNPPVVEGEGINVITKHAGSILTVPNDRSSVTCTKIGNKKKKCYSGSSPKCFKVPHFDSYISVTMSDSSHQAPKNSSLDSTHYYYMLTPNMTFVYFNSSERLYQNGSYLNYENYLYPCESNQSCQFDFLSFRFLLTYINPKLQYWGYYDEVYPDEVSFFTSLNKQLNLTTKPSKLAYKAPKLKAVSHDKHKSSASFIKVDKYVYIFLVFVTVLFTNL